MRSLTEVRMLNALTARAILFCAVYLSLASSSGVAKEQILLQSMTPKMDRLPPRKMLQGSVQAAEVRKYKCNLFGYSQSGSDYPKTVTYVTPNSLAWSGGLQAGDQIIEAHFVPPLAGMIIKRGAKKYFCVLDVRNLPQNKIASSRLTGGVDQRGSALGQRSIVIMIDDSASMGTQDCPGNQSRWEWCRGHVKDMYKDNNGLLSNNISIITFDSNFHSFRNCSADKLGAVFESVTPSGETNMAPALEEGFSLVRSQLERRQKALISIVTDGRPTDVESVKKDIISEVNRLAHPELLSIVFIEVGTPEHYLQEFDNDLVKQGAAKDVVTVIPFGSVNSQSLSVTLTSVVAKADEEENAKLSGSVTKKDEPKKGTPDNKPVVSHTPPVTPKPPIKAHPTGTSTETEKVIVKSPPVVEVDERESVLKHAANKTY